MYCPNCGAQNEDGIRFCAQSGSSLGVSSGAETAQGGSTESQPYENNPTPAYTQPPMYALPTVPPVITAVKKLGTSPLFLTAVISYSVTAFLSLISAFAPKTALLNTLYDLGYRYGIDIPYDFVQGFSVGSVFGSLLGMIPVLLFVAAMWMMYASAADRNAPYIKTTGLTIIKVLNIISLVSLCIGAAFAFVIMLIGLFSFGAVRGYDDRFSPVSESGSIVIIAAFFILLIVLVLGILYYAKLNKTLGIMRSTVTSGTVTGLASSYVAVITVIGAVLSFIGAFGNFVTAGFFTGLSSISSAVASFCFGLFLFRYNDTVRALMPQSVPMQNNMSNM